MSAAENLFYLLADLTIIIVAARSLGALAKRCGQPAVIGEIVAGILLGPTVLGRFFPDLPGQLFPKEVPLEPIANLGLVFFMFLVGLELDTGMMRKEGRRALQISLSGVVLPFVLGALLACLLVEVNDGGKFLDGTSHPPETIAVPAAAGTAMAAGTSRPPETFAFAMFLGAAMCITAFPVLARICVETGLYKTRVGTASLCAAAVDDVIAWILLAAVVGIQTSGSPTKAVPALLLTLLFVGFMFTGGRYLLGRLARRYDQIGTLTVDQVAFVLAGVLAAALTTEKIGIHAIFGAFVFGAAMPKRAGMTRALTEKVEDFTIIVLLPVFFCVTGLRTNLFALDTLSLLGWQALVLAAAIVGKFAGTGLAAYLGGFNKRDAVIVGALMNTRGLTELVILSIGLSLGVLSDRTFAMMVVMALATTVMAAPIVNRLISREELLPELVGAGEEQAPTARPAARVLVALGSPLTAPFLVDAASRLCGPRRPAELLLVRLIPTSRAPEFSTGLLDVESQMAAAVESMRQLVQQAAAGGLAARPISFLTDDVAPDLVRIAFAEDCDAVLLGWHRASLARHIVQALVHRIFLAAPCDVVVFVDREGQGVQAPAERPVLVALAGNDQDAALLRLGSHLAQNLGTGIRLLGFVGASKGRDPAVSAALAQRVDELHRDSGLWVVPVLVEGEGAAIEVVGRESRAAAVAVLGVGADWATARDFGNPTVALAEACACPALIVRAGEARTAISKAES